MWCPSTTPAAAGEPVRLALECLSSGERSVLDCDAVIFATGYRPVCPLGLLGQAHALCTTGDNGMVCIGRDYRVATNCAMPAGIYLQGATEHTHGIGSTLLSNTAVRAGEILGSILGHDVAPTARGASTSSAPAGRTDGDRAGLEPGCSSIHRPGAPRDADGCTAGPRMRRSPAMSFLPTPVCSAMTSTLAIEATGLVKSFGKTRAVDGVDLAVQRGAVYGVLGPNGAGKTTTIRMLATLLRPDAGSARVLGHDIVTEADAVRGLVSLTGQLASVDDDLTGRENLILLGRLLGYATKPARVRADELLAAFGLEEASGRLVKNYSGGMRRRLDLAASIVVTPELMFLDEPTTGLDPRSRNQVWDIIRALAGLGTTVLLCTQYLDEADQLADRIAVIDRGKVIAEGTPTSLKASVGGGALRVRLLDPEQRDEAARVLGRALDAEPHLETDPAALTVRIDDPERAAEAVAELSGAGLGLAGFSLAQPSLDEVFLALTGHLAEDDDTVEESGMSTAPERTRPQAAADATLHAALSSSARPPRPSPLSAAKTFGWRGMLKIKHVPEQLIDVTLTPVLFLVMFTYLFGGAMSGSTSEYLQFILPGILVQSVLFTAVYSGVALNTDMTKGVVDRFRSLPIWRPAPLVGAVIGDSRALRDRLHDRRRARLRAGLRRRRRHRRRAGRDAARDLLLVRAVVGVHDARAWSCAPPARS